LVGDELVGISRLGLELADWGRHLLHEGESCIRVWGFFVMLTGVLFLGGGRVAWYETQPFF